ncbi:MAG: MaoC/PaaZ C-terminal domain-containing protein [Halobacteriota archaeon]
MPRDIDVDVRCEGDLPSEGDYVRIQTAVDEDDVRGFADLTADENPLHLDASHAATSVFGRRVVHGVLSLGFVSAALSRLPGDVVLVSQDVEYVSPVYVDDVVRVECEVVSEADGGRYDVDTDVHRVGRDAESDVTLAVTGEAVVYVES